MRQDPGKSRQRKPVRQFAQTPPSGETGTSAAEFIPARPTLPKARLASRGCRGCHLWKVGTQTVFGEGPSRAGVLIVGEQPGDAEDREGRPFVGPSGKLLQRALSEAGIERGEVYVTNAVKHFKWTRDERSKRRIHKKPSDAEVRACAPWLRLEMTLVQPHTVICLGATAAQALLGKAFRVTRDRGRVIAHNGMNVIATVHPSSILRTPTGAAREKAYELFANDLRAAAKHISGG